MKYKDVESWEINENQDIELLDKNDKVVDIIYLDSIVDNFLKEKAEQEIPNIN